MSEASAKEFLGKLKANPDMRKELSEHVEAGAMQHAMEFASKNGHEFSHDDLMAAYASDLKERGYSDQDVEDLQANNKRKGQYGAAHMHGAPMAAPY